MTKKELLDLIDSMFDTITFLYSKNPGESIAMELGRLSDELDRAQNRPVRIIIRQNDSEYERLSAELNAVNSQLQQDLSDLQSISKLLDGITEAVQLVMSIVKLLAVA